MQPVVQIKVLEHGAGLELPAYQTELAAGADIRAAIDEDMTLAPMEKAIVPTGLSMAIEPGFEVQVRPRSGLAAKHGITVLNTPGTIDADYRGEVMIMLINLSDKPFTFARGERIAQLIVQPVPQAQFVVVNELDETVRGSGGFGSTGVA